MNGSRRITVLMMMMTTTTTTALTTRMIQIKATLVIGSKGATMMPTTAGATLTGTLSKTSMEEVPSAMLVEDFRRQISRRHRRASNITENAC